MRESDEILAEYLLKGGKMLASSCSTCGSPFFEYKGKTLCVVCEEHKGVPAKTPPINQSHDAVTASSECVSDFVDTSLSHQRASTGDGISRDREEISLDELVLAITATMEDLLKRIRNEPDTKRVRDLMVAVRDGAEALSYLDYS
jgi:UPF0148 protein